jgi:hypothetical protein
MIPHDVWNLDSSFLGVNHREFRIHLQHAHSELTQHTAS